MDARRFFFSTPWPFVEEINGILCQSGGYQAGRTSDGYESACILWQETSGTKLTLFEAASLCRRCHKMGPFLFLNGNTFVNCARIAFEPALNELPEESRTALRAAIGHFIAGTIGEDEFQKLLPTNAQ